MQQLAHKYETKIIELPQMVYKLNQRIYTLSPIPKLPRKLLCEIVALWLHWWRMRWVTRLLSTLASNTPTAFNTHASSVNRTSHEKLVLTKYYDSETNVSYLWVDWSCTYRHSLVYSVDWHRSFCLWTFKLRSRSTFLSRTPMIWPFSAVGNDTSHTFLLIVASSNSTPLSVKFNKLVINYSPAAESFRLQLWLNTITKKDYYLLLLIKKTLAKLSKA